MSISKSNIESIRRTLKNRGCTNKFTAEDIRTAIQVHTESDVTEEVREKVIADLITKFGVSAMTTVSNESFSLESEPKEEKSENVSTLTHQQKSEIAVQALTTANITPNQDVVNALLNKLESNCVSDDGYYQAMTDEVGMIVDFMKESDAKKLQDFLNFTTQQLKDFVAFKSANQVVANDFLSEVCNKFEEIATQQNQNAQTMRLSTQERIAKMRAKLNNR